MAFRNGGGGTFSRGGYDGSSGSSRFRSDGSIGLAGYDWVPTGPKGFDVDAFNAGNQRAANAENIAKYQGDLQKGLADQQNETARFGIEQNYKAAELPVNLRREVFYNTLPFISKMFDGYGGGTTGSFGLVGGSNTQQPNLPDNFVYSPDQIQQQVNSARAQGDQGAESQKRKMSGELAGRGFGSKSPLAMALAQAADSTARMSNADQEREIRFDAAGANANQALEVGTLAQNAWTNWNNADIERRKTQINALLGNQQNMAQLISALGGF